MNEPILLFNRVEFLWRDGVWRRRGEWVFDFIRHDDGCCTIDFLCINLLIWGRRGQHADSTSTGP